MKHNTLLVFQILCAAALMVVGTFLAGHNSGQVVQAEEHVPMTDSANGTSPESNENETELSARTPQVAIETLATTTDAQDVELVSHIGGIQRAVAVQGNYAYVGVGPRLVVLDISNPSDPTMIGRTDILPGVVWDVAVAGSYAYIADVRTYNTGGLQIIDISDPTHPTKVGSYDETSDQTYGVAIAGDYAYIVNYRGDFKVIDVSSPTQPTVAGAISSSVNLVQDVAVVGNVALVVGWWGGLQVIDISDPSNPTSVSVYDTPGYAEGVAASGNYAYIADRWEGLRIVDISDPAVPTEVGFYETSDARGVAVVGDYAYVADEDEGLKVIDVSNPAQPTQVGSYDTPGQSYNVAISGNYAYVADDGGGLRTVDISTPTTPSEVGSYNPVGSAIGVAVAGNYAYVAERYTGLQVVDISNPSVPSEVGFAATPGDTWGVAIAGSHAYIADGSEGLRIMDVSDPTAPTEVGFYDTSGQAVGLTVAGTYAYIADWTSGLRIVDISEPANPTEVGFYNPGGLTAHVAVAGNYAYVAMGSGSSGDEGLRVVDVSEPTAPIEVGFYDTLNTVYGVAVADNYAYIANDYGGLKVINISDPTNPTEVGSYDTPGRAIGVALVGNTVYITEQEGNLYVVDVSDPADPTEVGFFTELPGYVNNVQSHSLAVDGTYAYVARQGGGLFVLRYSPTLTVNTTDDELNSDGDCSLREAIQAANTDSAVDACTAGSGDDTITLSAGTYTLSLAGASEDNNQTGDLDIKSHLTINGEGAESSIIDANQIDRVLHIHSGYTVYINDVKITNGNTSGYGGGIDNAGTVTLNNCTISDSFADYSGGGIANRDGTMTLNNSVVSDNSIRGGDNKGGGIDNKRGTLTLNYSTVSGNSITYNSEGGGIANRGGTLTLLGSTVSGNQATNSSAGAGIYNVPDSDNVGIVNISGSTISSNNADRTGGGIYNEAYFGYTATINISDSTISDNDARDNGGGISNEARHSAYATINISDSTISGNNARDSGGGINNYNYGSSGATTVINIDNSTISGNNAEDHGGGIINTKYNADSDTAVTNINNSTIANNTADSDNNGSGDGGGIYNESGNTANLKNTIIASNSDSGGQADDCSGTLDSYGYNLMQNTSGCTLNDVQNAGTNITGQDALLGSLANNGGATETHALLNGSPAIDAASCTDIDGNTVSTDQRGQARPQGVTCDVGAFETGPPIATATATPTSLPTEPPTPSPTSTNTPTATATSTAMPSSTETVLPTSTATPAGTPIVVNTTDDELNSDGDCSLREAIQAANTDSAVDACTAGSGDDTITLPAGTYTLSLAGTSEDNNQTGDLDIKDNLTINGAGAASTIIDANQIDRVLHIHSGVTVEINEVKITNGNTSGNGGGIYNKGTLTISDSTISHNTSGYEGGGIKNYNATLTISGSTINNNTADYSGGGIHNYNATLTISGSTISGNSADYEGGGIQNDAVWGDSTATLNISNSTISGNSANYVGGGISNHASYDNTVATLNISNSTISGNTTSYYGGGIGNDASHGNAMAELNISNSTIANNTADSDSNGSGDGGGIYNESGNTANLKNTIIASNSDSGGQADDCSGTLDSYGYNLMQNTSGCTLNDVQNAGTNITGQDALLGSLANNGGATETHALLNGSPAIDAASCTDIDGNTVSTDQRGQARPQGVTCDVGAFETGPPIATATATPTSLPTEPPTPSPTSTNTPTATATATHQLPTNTPTATITPTPTSTPLAPFISDIRTTNVRDVSFTVSWLTDIPTTGEIHYGTDPNNLNQYAYDERGAATSDDTHYVIVSGLIADTTYYFDVLSSGTTDDNNGAHYSVTTGPLIGLPSSDTIHGHVLLTGTIPAEGAIVYMTLEETDGAGSPSQAAALSALVDSNGDWFTNLGNARTADFSAYFLYSASGDTLRLEAQGAADGIGCQKVDTANDAPATDIVLNVSHCTTTWPISLQSGWNSISLPIEPLSTPLMAADVCDDINAQGGHASEIDRWHNGGWDGHICDQSFNNFELVLGSDYFIKSNSSSTWQIEGYQVTEAVPLTLQFGWNSIAIPHTDGYSAESFCDEIISQGVTAVEIDRWYTGGWDGHICGLSFNDFNIERGVGYFVKVSSSGTVTPSELAGSVTPSELAGKTLPLPPILPDDIPTGETMLVRDLRISNLNDTSVTLSWTTDEAITGYVRFGSPAPPQSPPTLGGKSLNNGREERIAYDSREATTSSKTHLVRLDKLTPESTYDFEIVSGAEVVERGTFMTDPSLESVPESDTIYGQLFWSNGTTPAAGRLVYLTLQEADGAGSQGEATILSTLTDENGYWHANLGNARLAEGGDAFSYSATGDMVVLTVQSGTNSTTITLDTSSLRPAAPIILEETALLRLYLPLIGN